MGGGKEILAPPLECFPQGKRDWAVIWVLTAALHACSAAVSSAVSSAVASWAVDGDHRIIYPMWCYVIR